MASWEHVDDNRKSAVRTLNADPVITPRKNHIDIVPLGHVDPLAVSVVAANLQSLIGLNADVLAMNPDPEYAYIPQRRQFDAIKIIKEISRNKQGARLKLAVTELDICTPILTFVFGESQLGGAVALVSLNRLQGGAAETVFERAAKISVHEVGHVLGLEHCWEIRCLMHFSRDIEQLDSLPLQFCSACEYEATRRIRHLYSTLSRPSS